MISPRGVHKSGTGGSDQVLQHVESFFKESDRVHDCLEVSTTQQRGEWTHHSCSAVATDTEDSDSDNEDSVIPPLICP